MEALRGLYVVIQLRDQITDKLKNVNRAVDSVKSRINSLTEAIEQYKWAVVGAGAALSAFAYGGFRFFSDATKELANFQDAMSIFRAYAGENADAILKAMEEAAEGTIDTTQMILNANRAIVMGIDPEYLPRMMKIARAAARAMGTDVQYMFESIAVGSARQSKLILDNLGIIVDAEAAYEKYAKQLGKTANQLTEAEKRQAFLNAVMEAGENLVRKVDLSQETLNEQLMKSRVAWTEFKKALAEGALPVITAFTDKLEKLTAWLKDLPKPVKAVVGTLGVLATGASAVVGPLLLQAAALAYLRVQLIQLGGVSGIIAGLRAAMLGFATSIWAAIAPLLPIIAIIGAVVGAILLLQDVLVKGWEESYLGKFVGWLLEKLPFFKPVAEAVAGAIDWLRRGFEWLAGEIRGFINWIQQAIDSLGPLKLVILAPVLSISILTRSFGTLRNAADSALRALRTIWDSTIGFIISKIRGLIDWIWKGIDSLGPLKYAFIGPIGAIILLAQNFDKLKDIAVSALKALRIIWDRTIGAIISKIAEFISMLQNAWKAVAENPMFKAIGFVAGGIKSTLGVFARKKTEERTIQLVETKKKEELLRRNITEEEIRRKAVEQYEYIKSLKIRGVTNEDEIKRRLETEFGEIIVNPQIIPYVGRPEYDKEFYEEGSIKLKLQEPVFKPEVEEPKLPRLDNLLLRIRPVFEAIKLPILHTQALIRPVIELPRLDNLLTGATMIQPQQAIYQVKHEHRIIQIPKIEINVQGIKDPERVAELVERRLQRQFNAMGVY